MDTETLTQLAALLQANSWLAAALLVIPILDSAIAKGRWPFTVAVPVRYRLALMGFGAAVVFALQAVQAGQTWRTALVSSLVVFGLSVLKQGGSLFGGDDDKTPRPPVLPLLALLALCSGCAGTRDVLREDGRAVLTTAETLCVLANAWLPVPELATACHLVDALIPAAAKIAEEHRAGVTRKASTCRLRAGSGLYQILPVTERRLRPT